MDYSSSISALAALLALGFGIWVHRSTRALLKPTERPVVSMTKSPGKAEVMENPDRLKATMYVGFKNVGKHPLENLELSIGGALSNQPQDFSIGVLQSVANRIDPDGIFGQSLNGEFILTDQQCSLLTYIRCTYNDAYFPKNKYLDEYWLTLKIGADYPGHASVEDRKILEPYVRTIYKNLDK